MFGYLLNTFALPTKTDSPPREVDTTGIWFQTIKIGPNGDPVPESTNEALTEFDRRFAAQEELLWAYPCHILNSSRDAWVCLAWRGGAIVACLKFIVNKQEHSTSTYTTRVACISDFKAAPKGDGIGSGLFKHVLDSLKEDNIDMAIVEVDMGPGSTRLMAYYGSHGFLSESSDCLGSDPCSSDLDPVYTLCLRMTSEYKFLYWLSLFAELICTDDEDSIESDDDPCESDNDQALAGGSYMVEGVAPNHPLIELMRASMRARRRDCPF